MPMDNRHWFVRIHTGYRNQILIGFEVRKFDECTNISILLPLIEVFFQHHSQYKKFTWGGIV